MTGESWTEERNRLTRLLKAIEAGTVTHIDEEELRQLQATTPRNVAQLRERLADLDARLRTPEERAGRHGGQKNGG